MGRANTVDSKVYRQRIESGLFFGVMNSVPADNFVLDEDAPTVQLMVPAGVVDVLMPESTPARKGLAFYIANFGGAGAITLKTSADALFTSSIVLLANESTWVVCTGHATAALGWIASATAVPA